ncbi:hypothetical protein [Streptomyces echinatus]|uniref:hypothetical protein n=1 Tax=Streptomyces echinatus TaxID=67293 RepID=UPI003CD06E1C
MGEFFALVPSFEQFAAANGNTRAKVLARHPDRDTATFLRGQARPDPSSRRHRQHAAATSPLSCTGRRSWRGRPTDADLAKPSRRSPRCSPRTSERVCGREL